MVPVEKNKEYTVTIETVSSDGNGVTHIDGFTVFVPQTAECDRVKIKINTIKKRFALASLTEIITPSNKRQETDCPHCQKCGGCHFRHIKYEEQLKIKKSIVQNAMRRIGNFKDFHVDKIIGMDNPERYRNKVIFQIGINKEDKPVFGFFLAKSHKIIPISDCKLCDKTFIRIAEAITACLTDGSGKNPAINQIFIRRAASTGEIMVVLSSHFKPRKNPNELAKQIKAVSNKIVSVILQVQSKKNMPPETVILYGKNKITDTLFNLKFLISPQSFFQVNPVQTEKLYATAMDFAGITSTDTVMDVYCGIGTITLCSAKRAKKVIGIEIIKEAIDDAKENAKLNGIKNTEFYAGAAADIVPALIKNGKKTDIVILDPPRAGSDEKTLKTIVSAAPKKIIYISCNPSTLARDAKLLAYYGYSISRSAAVDMFPYTNHVETVLLMIKDI